MPYQIKTEELPEICKEESKYPECKECRKSIQEVIVYTYNQGILDQDKGSKGE